MTNHEPMKPAAPVTQTVSDKEPIVLFLCFYFLASIFFSSLLSLVGLEGGMETICELVMLL
jgi:hypothetical protein